MYSPQTHPKMFRGGRMTGAAFVRESRRLNHYKDGLYFQGAHRPDASDALKLALSQANEASSALYAAYKAGR